MSNADKVKHLSPLEMSSFSQKEGEGNLSTGREGRTSKRSKRNPDPLSEGSDAAVLSRSGAIRAKSVTPPLEGHTARKGLGQSQTFVVDEPELLRMSDLPMRKARGSIGGIVSFLLCVVIPSILAGVYYFVYASPQYEAGFHFSVRDTSTATSTSSTVASSLLSSMGIATSGGAAENYMVVDYITSRQAVDDLQAKVDVTKLYSYPFVDWWSRFDEAKPIERFANYWQYMVTATYDEIKSTGVVKVRAFTPDDAYLIANTLVRLSEDLVNESAQQPQREAVTYAEIEMKRAEERLKKIRGELVDFRNKSGLVDPTTGVVVGNATLASTLRTTLAQIETELAAAQSQKLGPDAPLIRNLRSRQQATKQQIAAVEAEVDSAKTKGGALSEVVAKYEQLEMERQFAQNMLTSTMQSYEQARSNAMAKRIFITAYVRPAMPQASLYPNRFVATLTFAGACLLLWTIALLLVRSIREHLA